MSRSPYLSILVLLIVGMTTVNETVQAAKPPEWAVAECNGLSAFAEVVHHWLDRQNPDGSFGFGLDDDCEFYKAWPIFVLAADDQRVLDSLRKAMDWVWYDDRLQDGFVAAPRDVPHASEVTSYTAPLMSIIDYGSPLFIERLMATSKNIEKWTSINQGGHRHFRCNWLGSQECPEYAYFASDVAVISRATIPMMHLLWYNRDGDLARFYTEWGRAWVDHARETTWGKPYGLLPIEVVFETDEAGGFTKNWRTSAAARSRYDRLYEMLMVNYMITGDAEFLLPIRATLTYQASTDGIQEHLWEMYRALTGDTQYDRYAEDRPLRATRQLAITAGQKAVDLARKSLEIAKTINVSNSTDNYRAQLDNEPLCYHLYELYLGSNCWPAKDHVDLPFPAVRWRHGRYELGVMLLEHGQTGFKAVCCNVGKQTRAFGAQFFELQPGAYSMTLGVDTDADDRVDRPVREELVRVERGTEITFELEPAAEYILEMRQLSKGPGWSSRADLAICDCDVFCSSPAPEAGTAATLKIRVHNIGSQDAAHVSVWAEELPGGRLIGQGTIAWLPKPRNMVPSSVIVTMPWTVGADAQSVHVVIDNDQVVEEIYEGNNRTTVALARITEGPRLKRKVYVPEWHEQERLSPVAKYTAAYIAEPITIDGKLDEPAWSKAERRGPLKNLREQPNEKATYVRIAYGPDALYYAMECPEPNMDLLIEIATKHDEHAIFESDSFEFFIDPNLSRRTYYQFAACTNGLTAEGRHFNYDLFNEPWECRVFKGRDFWSAEAKIPYASINAVARPGDVWGMNIYRTTRSFPAPKSKEEREKGWKNSERNALSPTFSDFHQPRRFAEVTFGPRP